ncbi:MAG TPA: hypothetical protein VNN25_08180 [Thermoanaerobaculia bacterium]|nr:hypothetical protein [Thermoanaerobaculia bacterium]
MTQVEDQTEWVSQIASGDGRIFLYKDAAGSQKVSLGGLDIANEEIKDRAVRLTPFDEETNSPRLDAQHGICFMGNFEAEDVLVELLSLDPAGRSQDHIA